jgi:subfamily B ATP-binding cassette protein MsbA
MQGRTVLIIAHRLSTIESADRIAVIEDGRVAEQGSHAELITQGGLYAQLHRLQFNV